MKSIKIDATWTIMMLKSYVSEEKIFCIDGMGQTTDVILEINWP
jgi:hypothetical protein